MADNGGARPVGQRVVGNDHRIGQRVGKVPQARTEHDGHARQLAAAGANGGRRFLDAIELRLCAHSSIPAMVAVRKLAKVPASIARSPRRARSWRRSGASAPMPPIWMPIELKFAKPQSAKVAIVNDLGSSIGFSGPSCEYATNSLSTIRVPSRFPTVAASCHGTPSAH